MKIFYSQRKTDNDHQILSLYIVFLKSICKSRVLVTTQVHRGKVTEAQSCLAYLLPSFLIKLLSIRSISRLNSNSLSNSSLFK